jgi:hypothetical protein
MIGRLHSPAKGLTRALMIAILAVVLLQVVFTYAPPFHLVFGTRPIVGIDIVAIAVGAVGLVVVLEIEKAIRFALQAR